MGPRVDRVHRVGVDERQTRRRAPKEDRLRRLQGPGGERCATTTPSSLETPPQTPGRGVVRGVAGPLEASHGGGAGWGQSGTTPVRPAP